MFNFRRNLFLLVFFMIPKLAQGVTYQTPLDLVKWEFKGSKFYCELFTNVERFGQISFNLEPNKPLALEMKTYNPLKNASYIILYLMRPSWNESLTLEEIKRENLRKSRIIYESRNEITRLIDQMGKGNWMSLIFFDTKAKELFRVNISNIHLINSLNQFNDCRRNLPKLGYKDVRDLVLNYSSGQKKLSSNQKNTLNNLIDYLEADNQIEKILIDSHTDNIGNAIANLQLSKERADDVATYLIDYGVSKDLLEIRAHGDRYPIAKNNTKKGLSINRRVTIRVLKDWSKSDEKLR